MSWVRIPPPAPQKKDIHMFHIREENEEIKQGFNFYPLSSSTQFGVVFRWNTKVYQCRYSKRINYWFINRIH